MAALQYRAANKIGLPSMYEDITMRFLLCDFFFVLFE
jgi:hypothetical protein